MYEINESLARTAHEMNSFSEYKKGSTTAEYSRYVTECEAIAEAQKAKYPERADEIDGLADRYAKQLAEWYNTNSAIEAMCPSIMISGGSNFPVRKKEAQNSRRKAHWEKWNEIQKIPDRIKTIGTGGIQSNDANAIEKLKAKLERLEQAQETMKAANAYYKKNGTLKGFDGMSEETIAEVEANMVKPWHLDKKPFAGYNLSNNSADIRRVKERIAELEAAKAQETKSEEVEGIDGLELVENTELMRVQLIFDGKPSEDVRNILKKWAFRWSPKESAWQRQLTDNGRYAAQRAIEEIKAMG